MSCHVMSCRHYCIEFLKNHFQKLFYFSKLFINILQASLLVFIRIATPHFIRLAMTLLYAVITRLFIAEVIYLVDCHDFRRSLAMTKFFAMTKIFNSISFRDLSLLFIKKFITKGDLNYVKSQNNF